MSKKAVARIMPHSVEAEQSVLGCILIDDKASFEILTSLTENDFYVQAHKIIFQAMYEIYGARKPVDIVTVTDELERRNLLESSGGIDYLTTLSIFVPSASNFSHYVDITRRNSTLRSLIHAANNIIENSYSGSDKDEAISSAQKLIFDISQVQESSSLAHIKHAVVEAIGKFEIIQKDRDSLKGISTGLYGLDKITNGLQNSDLIILAARPGFGKTSLAMNIVNHAAINGGKKVAIFSLEMAKVQLAQRSLCSIAHVGMGKALKGDLNTSEWKALWAANEKLSNAEIYVDDSSLNNTVDILSKCRRLKVEKGLDLIMIDYLQLMNASGRVRDNRQQEISEISRNLKILARELNVPVIVLSQLSRAVESRSKGEYKPVLSDLRESGAIEQDADIVMFIHRPDMYNDLEVQKIGGGVLSQIIIAKHRNGELGDVNVVWHGDITTFKNTGKDSNAMSLEKDSPKRGGSKANSGDTSGLDAPLPEITPLDESDIADIF